MFFHHKTIKSYLFVHKGPGTIKGPNGNDILVGVASNTWFFGALPLLFTDVCGPGVNGGLGLFKIGLSNYVHVLPHLDWICNTISKNSGETIQTLHKSKYELTALTIINERLTVSTYFQEHRMLQFRPTVSVDT